MTLVAAAHLDDGTIWMGGDRHCGTNPIGVLAHPKIFRITDDTNDFLIGFAGTPRVAQTVLAVTPPVMGDHSLHWWLTEYADQIRERAEQSSLLVDCGRDGGQLAGDSDMLLVVGGHIVHLGCDLSWESVTRPYEAVGCGAYPWLGAVDALAHMAGVGMYEAVSAAWVAAQRINPLHGLLADELTVTHKRLDL